MWTSDLNEVIIDNSQQLIRQTLKSGACNLYLNHFELTEIPVEALQAKETKKLLVSCNNITKLPSNFGVAHASLVLLDLSYNRINELPASIGKLKLPKHSNFTRKINKLKGAHFVKQSYFPIPWRTG
jgi:Leucine-rich repeat (LRR) protein